MLKTIIGVIQLAIAIAGIVVLCYHWDTVKAFAQANLFSLVAGLHLAIGVGCFLTAGRAILRQAAFVRRANRAQALVIRVHSSLDDEADFSWYTPVLSFHSDEGEETTFRPPLATTNEKRWRTGMAVPILYDPADPKKAIVDNWLKWRDANLPILFGVAASGIGWAMLRLGGWDNP